MGLPCAMSRSIIDGITFNLSGAATLDMCLVADHPATPSLNESWTVPRATRVHVSPRNLADEKNRGGIVRALDGERPYMCYAAIYSRSR